MLEFAGKVRDDNSLVVTTVAMDCDELLCGETRERRHRGAVRVAIATCIHPGLSATPPAITEVIQMWVWMLAHRKESNRQIPGLHVVAGKKDK